MSAPAPDYDVVGAIVDFEAGDISTLDALRLFGHLIRTGQAWSLQGSYGRTASQMIEDGWLDREGNLTEQTTKDLGL